MCSDENEDLCDYQIVEFITRGRPSVKKIDLVPIKWIQYDNKKGKLVTKFMPPSYGEEDFKLITDLAKNLTDAPNDWVTYGIKIRARASKFSINIFYYFLDIFVTFFIIINQNSSIICHLNTSFNIAYDRPPCTYTSFYEILKQIYINFNCRDVC